MYLLLFQGWPDSLTSFLNFLSVLNFEIGYFGVGCDVKNSFITLMFFKLSLPLLTWLSLVLLEFILKKGKVDQKRIYFFTSFCLFFTVFFSMQIFSSMFQIFNCTAREDGSHWLKAEPQFQCFSSQWYSIVGADFIFMLLYFVLLPLFVLKRAWREERQRSSILDAFWENLSSVS
jgi:hypothetical protein